MFLGLFGNQNVYSARLPHPIHVIKIFSAFDFHVFFFLHCEVLKTFCCGYMTCVCACARVQACVGHGMGWRSEDSLEFGSLSSILVETGSLCYLAHEFLGILLSPPPTYLQECWDCRWELTCSTPFMCAGD